MADQPGAPSQDGRPDLNDPNVRMSRADAMKAMVERRHENLVANDMAPADAAAFTARNDDVETPQAAAPAAPALDVGATPAPPAEERTTPAARAAQVDRQLATPTIISDDDLGNFQVRKKVNGVETIVSLKDLRDSAQKNDAADEFLAKAKTTLAEITAVSAQARALTAGLTAPVQPAAPAATAASPTDSTPDPLDAAVDHLFGGDDAGAKKAFREAMGRHDADALAREVEQRVVIRSALRQFAKDHRDIAADPTLRQKADAFLYQELTARGAARLEDLDSSVIPDVIALAGTQTKDWLREIAGVPTAPTAPAAPSLDDKRRAKEAIDELPTASVRASVVAPPPRTASTTIADMQRSRHPGALASR